MGLSSGAARGGLTPHRALALVRAEPLRGVRMPRLSRLLSLALLFSARRRLRAEDAAQQFEVSVRTIYRDLAALQEAGFPLVGTPGDGYTLARGAELRPLAVTPEEAEALVMAARLLERGADEGLRASLTSVLAKLEGALPPEAVARIKRQHVTVRLPESREVGPLSLILDAVHHRRVLRITYAGVERDELSEREIEPLGLVRSGVYWLVPAWCRLRQDLRVFRSDRLQAAVSTGELYAAREGVTMEELTRRYQAGDERRGTDTGRRGSGRGRR